MGAFRDNGGEPSVEKVNEGEIWNAFKDMYKVTKVSKEILVMVEKEKKRVPDPAKLSDDERMNFIGGVMKNAKSIIKKAGLSPDAEKTFSDSFLQSIEDNMRKLAKK